MENVISVRLSPDFYDSVAAMIRRLGLEQTQKTMVEDVGLEPSFVKVVIRKIIKERGW